MRCDYCAFATYTDRDHLMADYAEACRREIERARLSEGLGPATSVYFGGGTPSRLPVGLLVGILDAVHRTADAEVTVECNPEDATPERLAAYVAGGVTRLSLGVQSTAPHVLDGLGRRHGTEQVARAMAAVASAGFASWSCDLIFGGAGESDADWERSLGDVLGADHPPPHVSAYALTVEPGTALAGDPGRHPDDDVQARRYERADLLLHGAGYRWEEISNWARPGHECRHNGHVWAQGDYRGIGSAAHSHRAGRRWWNVRTPDRYIDLVGRGRDVTAGEELLTGAQRRAERLALALRTPAGVPAACLPDHPDLDGLVTVAAGRAVLTVRGRLLATSVTALLRPGGEPEADPAPGPGEPVGVGARRPPGTMPPYA
jgi:oxygen-independent coproporphyrinogen-3 oxidase